MEKIFAHSQPVIQAVIPAEQIEFSNWGLAMVANKPTVRTDLIRQCTSYRQAVRLCKALSRIKYTNRSIAECAGLYASHASEYFAESPVSRKGIPHRDLPASKIREVEEFFGNTAITQWLAFNAHLTVLEEIQLGRAA